MVKATKKQLEILDLICSKGSTRKVAKELGKSQSAIVKTVTSLTEKGLLSKERQGYNTYFYNITPLGYLLLKKGSHGIDQKVFRSINSKERRLHKIGLRFEIRPSLLAEWQRFNNKFFEMKDFRTVRLKNNVQHHFQLKNMKAKTTTKAIIVYPEDVVSESPNEAVFELMEIINNIGFEINKRFKTSKPIFLPERTDITQLEGELAFMNDQMAKDVINRKHRLYVYVGGVKRFQIDNSGEGFETEAVSSKDWHEDSLNYQKVLKAVAEGIFDPYKMAEDISEIKNVVGVLGEHLAKKELSSDQKSIADFKQDYFG